MNSYGGVPTRLFIGLAMPEDSSLLLSNAISSLPDLDSAKVTLPENYHITLAFLGQREPEEIDTIVPLMQQAAKTVSPFMLLPNRLGFFGRETNAILYAAVPYNELLDILCQNLRSALQNANQIFDEKPFRPHITLAKKAKIEPASLSSIYLNCPFWVDHLTLYHSTRVHDVLRYLSVAEAPFSLPIPEPLYPV